MPCWAVWCIARTDKLELQWGVRCWVRVCAWVRIRHSVHLCSGQLQHWWRWVVLALPSWDVWLPDGPELICMHGVVSRWNVWGQRWAVGAILLWWLQSWIRVCARQHECHSCCVSCRVVQSWCCQCLHVVCCWLVWVVFSPGDCVLHWQLQRGICVSSRFYVFHGGLVYSWAVQFGRIGVVHALSCWYLWGSHRLDQQLVHCCVSRWYLWCRGGFGHGSVLG